MAETHPDPRPRDWPLQIAVVGSTVLAIPGVLAVGVLVIAAVGFGNGTPDAFGPILLILVPIVAGFALLKGYWGALRGTLASPKRLWWASLVYNGLVIAAAVWAAGEVPLALLLAVWGLYMCLLSGYRALGIGPAE